MKIDERRRGDAISSIYMNNDGSVYVAGQIRENRDIPCPRTPIIGKVPFGLLTEIRQRQGRGISMTPELESFCRGIWAKAEAYDSWFC